MLVVGLCSVRFRRHAGSEACGQGRARWGQGLRVLQAVTLVMSPAVAAGAAATTAVASMHVVSRLWVCLVRPPY